MSLEIVAVEAYRVEWGGRPMSSVYFTRQEAEERLARLRSRYSDGTLDLLASTKSSDPVWEATWPVGETRDGDEILHAERVRTKYKKDAEVILRERLDRERLPNGITWTQAE